MNNESFLAKKGASHNCQFQVFKNSKRKLHYVNYFMVLNFAKTAYELWHNIFGMYFLCLLLINVCFWWIKFATKKSSKLGKSKYFFSTSKVQNLWRFFAFAPFKSKNGTQWCGETHSQHPQYYTISAHQTFKGLPLARMIIH